MNDPELDTSIDDPLRAQGLVGDNGVYTTQSGQTAVTSEVLDGRRFTHRLTMAEIVVGNLRVVPDLVPFADFGPAWASTVGPLVVEPGDVVSDTLLVGPDGWLEGIPCDSVIEFAVDHGELKVSVVGSPPIDPDVVALIGTIGPDGLPVSQFFASLMAADGAAFADVIAPLVDHVAAAERLVVGDRIVQPGAAAAAATPQELLDELVRLTSLVANGQDVNATLAVQALGNVDVAASYAEQLLGAPQPPVDAVEAVVAAVHASAGDGPGIAFVESRIAEHRGDIGTAERRLQQALDAKPNFAAALIDSAAFASDRGRASRAYTYLVRAGVERDDPELLLLEHFSKPGPYSAERNDACPCGSGRRYKKCHSVTNGFDTEHLRSWMHQKLITFVQRTPQRPRLWVAAAEFAGLDEPMADPTTLIAAASDPLLIDLLIFDGETVGQFLDQRGSLLPPEERTAMQAWRSVTPMLEQPAGPEGEDGAHLTITVELAGASLPIGAPLAVPPARVSEVEAACAAGSSELRRTLGAFVGPTPA